MMDTDSTPPEAEPSSAEAPVAATTSAPGMKWYVLRVASNKEEQVRDALLRLYGGAYGREIAYAEALEISEYGAVPAPEDIRRLFPFFPTD